MMKTKLSKIMDFVIREKSKTTMREESEHKISDSVEIEKEPMKEKDIQKKKTEEKYFKDKNMTKIKTIFFFNFGLKNNFESGKIQQLKRSYKL